MILMTKCNQCNELIVSNGKAAIRNEITKHYTDAHPEKLKEWNEFNQEILAAIIDKQQQLREKALELISEPKYLVGQY